METLLILLPLTLIAAGTIVMVAALRFRARALELVHRERLAMIERGLTPTEPAPGVSRHPRDGGATGVRSRSYSLGIITVGMGLALMVLVGVAGGAPEAAVGTGGAIAILGASFIVRALLTGGPSGPPPTDSSSF